MSEPSTLRLAIEQVISNVARRGMQILEIIVEIAVEDVFGGGLSQVRVCYVVAY